MAATALESDGIGGVLVVKVPRKSNVTPDVQFTTGSAQITLDF